MVLLTFVGCAACCPDNHPSGLEREKTNCKKCKMAGAYYCVISSVSTFPLCCYDDRLLQRIPTVLPADFVPGVLHEG